MARVVGRSTQYWSAFSPSNIPGLTLWYDFSDRSTFDLSGEYQITRVRDKSGKGFHGTASNGPNAYWVYDGASKGALRVPRDTSVNFELDLSLNSSTNFYSAAIAFSGGGSNLGYILSPKEPGGFMFRWNGASNSWAAGTTTTAYIGTNNSTDRFSMNIGSFTGGINIRVGGNGTITGNITTTNAPPLVKSGIPMKIGTFTSNDRNVGSIYELLVFSNLITDYDRAALEEYLSNKWMRQDTPGITAPTDISGCNLWLDVSGGASNFVFATGSNIRRWIDKSPCNYDVSTSGTTLFPVWQDVSQVVSFLSLPTMFTNRPEPSRGEETGFIAGTVLDNNAVRTLIGAKTGVVGPWRQIISYLGNSWIVRLSNVTPAITQFNFSYDQSIFNATNPHEVCWRIKGKEFFSRITGQAGNYMIAPNWADVSGTGTTQIGNGAYAFKELILYDRALSSSEISNVSAYLTRKWNLSNYKTITNGFESNVPYDSPPAFSREFQIPYDLPGCLLWLDAKDTNTIQLDASGNVLRWLDKSGWQNDVSAGPSRPAYSNETLIFNSNQMTVRNLTLTSLNNFRFGPELRARYHTFIALHKPASATGNTGLIDFSTGYGSTVTSNISFPTIDASLNPRGYVNSTDAQTLRTSSMFLENSLTTEYNIISASISSNRNTIYRNGVIQYDASRGAFAASYNFTGSTPITSIGRWGFSNSTFYQGEVKELFIFDRALSGFAIQQVETYLAKKWNLASLLPSNHPAQSNRLSIATSVLPSAIGVYISLWVDAMSFASQYSNNATITTNWENKAYQPSSVVPSGTPKFITNAYRGRPAVDTNSGAFTATFSADASLTSFSHCTFLVASYDSSAGVAQTAMAVYRQASQTLPRIQVAQVSSNSGLQTIARNNVGTAVGTITHISFPSANVPFLIELSMPGGGSMDTTINGYPVSNSVPSMVLGAGGSWGVATLGQDSGGAGTWRGKIYEAITYRINSSLFDDNEHRLKIRGYLANKWGITDLLPTYYPFKSLRP